jgi:rSAM/selenodomain-associated transferase 1
VNALDPVVLVVAKAPIAGLAKTRLIPGSSAPAAARIAAAALLDTLDAVLATPDVTPVVALTGRLADAENAAELAHLLDRCTVIAQRGRGLDDRLAAAHEDVAERFPGQHVLQIGMDTPQVRAELLTGSLARLDEHDAVLGPAADGGWWALGLRDARDGAALRGVPMSQSDTATRTRTALYARGLAVGTLPTLSDVDTMADVLRVAERVPGSRFATAAAEVTGTAAEKSATALRGRHEESVYGDDVLGVRR